MENKTPEDVKPDFFCKPPYRYDPGVTAILDSEDNLVLDIRGWGRIQKMNNAVEVQDKFGYYVAELLNGSELTKLREENENYKACFQRVDLRNYDFVWDGQKSPRQIHLDKIEQLTSQLSKAKEFLQFAIGILPEPVLNKEIEQFINEIS